MAQAELEDAFTLLRSGAHSTLVFSHCLAVAPREEHNQIKPEQSSSEHLPTGVTHGEFEVNSREDLSAEVLSYGRCDYLYHLHLCIPPPPALDKSVMKTSKQKR